MSNVSSGASVSAGGRSQGNGVPSTCWCGHPIVELVSKTTKNPDRPFYRCKFAKTEKLSGDTHVFKWIDEVEETVDVKIKRLEDEVREVKDILDKFIEFEKNVYLKVEMEVNDRITERLAVAVAGANSGMKKTLCFLFLVGCVLTLASGNLLAK